MSDIRNNIASRIVLVVGLLAFFAGLFLPLFAFRLVDVGVLISASGCLLLIVVSYLNRKWRVRLLLTVLISLIATYAFWVFVFNNPKLW